MADERVTDLTEEGSESDGEASNTGNAKKQKKPKPAKPSKAPKTPKEKNVKSPKEKKVKGSKAPKEKGERSGGTGVIIIMILILAILITGFVLAMNLEILGAREVIYDIVGEPIMNFLIFLDPRMTTIHDQLQLRADEEHRRLDLRESVIAGWEHELENRERAIESRESLLDRREVELDSREAQIRAFYERTIPLHRRVMTEQEIEDMNALSRTFQNMSPSDAATILIELYDPRDIAAILYFMAERNAAAILAEMRPAQAAEITEILLYS